MMPEAPYPVAVTAQETAFIRYVEGLAVQEGLHVLIYRDYLYTAWLAGMTYANSQGL